MQGAADVIAALAAQKPPLSTGEEPGFAAAVLLLAHLLLWAPTALFAMIWLPLSGSGKTA